MQVAYSPVRQMDFSVHLNYSQRCQNLFMPFIDDSYLQGDNVSECNDNITDTIDLFTRLGFIIYPLKSVPPLTQIFTFLELVLNWVNMSVR